MPKFNDEEETVTYFGNKQPNKNKEETKEYSLYNKELDETKEYSTYNKEQIVKEYSAYNLEDLSETKKYSLDNNKATKIFTKYNKFEIVEKDISKLGDEEETITYIKPKNAKNSAHSGPQTIDPQPFIEESTLIDKVEESTIIDKVIPQVAAEIKKKSIPEEETDILASENHEESTNILLENNGEEENIETKTSIKAGELIKNNKKLILNIGAIISILLLIMFILLTISNNNKVKTLKQLKEKKRNELREKIINQHFMGINEYKLQKWDSAIDYFDNVLEMKPDHLDAQKYKKIAISEKKNEILFKNSRQLARDENYATALTEINKIENLSSYHDEAIKLKKLVEEKLSEKEKEKEAKVNTEKEKELKKKSIKKRKVKRKRVSYKTDRYAKRLYKKAYRNERKYPKYSKKTYKKIMSMLPSSYYLYKQAKRRLGRLK
jgi:hypothetical protein